MKTYVFRVVVEPDEGHWFAYCPVLEEKGGATWGYTREEALRNIREVIEMTIQGLIEHGKPIPEEPEAEVRIKNIKEAAELHIEELGIENIKLKEIQRRQIEMVVEKRGI